MAVSGARLQRYAPGVRLDPPLIDGGDSRLEALPRQLIGAAVGLATAFAAAISPSAGAAPTAQVPDSTAAADRATVAANARLSPAGPVPGAKAPPAAPAASPSRAPRPICRPRACR